MNEFWQDDAWQKGIRDRILKPFYREHSWEGRYVFADKGKLADKLQREMAVDTVLQKEQNALLSIEEKIVRWKGKAYKAFVLETWSCTVAGRESQGWMYTAQCDYLFYCFVQEDEKSCISYLIPFDKLKAWFFENDRYLNFPKTITNQINKTECRVVNIVDVKKAIPGIERYVIYEPFKLLPLPDSQLNQFKQLSLEI